MISVFKKLRNPVKAKSIVAIVLFGAIIIVFVFFNLTPQQMGVGGGFAAIVDDKIISMKDYQRQYQSMEEQYRTQLQGLPDAQRQSTYQDLRRRALQGLVQSEVAAKAVLDLGFSISDEAIRKEILDVPLFNKDGRFQRETYDRYLEYMGLSPGEFETQLRKQMAVSMFRDSVRLSADPGKYESSFQNQLKAMKLNIEFVEIDRSRLLAAIKASDAEVNSFLQDSKNLSQLQDYYKQNKSVKFSSPEQVRVRHILVRSDASDAAKDAAAKKKAEGLRILAETQDFIKLAQQNSEDPPTKGKGGDLGFIQRGQQVEELEQVAFATDEGKISTVFKSPFGYHFLKVEQKKPARELTFDEAKLEAAQALASQVKVDSLLIDLEKATPEAAAPIFQKLISEKVVGWVESGEFNLSQSFIPKIGSNEKLIEVALEQKSSGSQDPKFLKTDGKYLLVKTKAPNAKAPAEDSSPAFSMAAMEERYMSSMRAMESYQRWIEEKAKQIKVTTNAQLLDASVSR